MSDTNSQITVRNKIADETVFVPEGHIALRGGRHLRLLKIVKAKDGKHKYAAVFRVEGTGGKHHEKVVKFGAVGYDDFTKHKDKERRRRYIERHGRGREHWSSPDTPGALSRWVLWNKTSLRESIKDFKRRFHLHAGGGNTESESDSESDSEASDDSDDE